MIDLNEIQVFIKVIEAGSFVGAGRLLNMPSSTISRKVQNLEDSLEVRLLNRSTRKLSLTDQGRQYYEQCQLHISSLEEANLLISESQLQPKGVIRITAPLGFSIQMLQPLLNEFLSLYPGISIELDTADAMVDLIDDRIDVAFRIGVLKDSSLIARKLGGYKAAFCASPNYLKENGTPKHPSELANHQCVLMAKSLQNQSWKYKDKQGISEVAVNGQYATNNMSLAVQAALNGLGISQAPSELVAPYVKGKSLELILAEFDIPTGDIFVVYQSHKYLAKPVRLFIDYAIDNFQKIRNQQETT